MIENSSAGLEMLGSEVTVTVTREEHHQSVLARYPVAAGAQRHVAVELGWCTIGSGKHRGQPAIEVRLDGHRVGELTHAMSQRYGQLVSQVAFRGGKPGCEATIQRSAKGLEVVLRLPRHAASTVHAGSTVPAASNIAGPPPTLLSAPASAPELASVTIPMAPVTAPPVPPRHRGTFAAHRPAWIAAAVIAVLFIAILASNHDSSSTAKPQTQLNVSITTATTTAALAPAYTQPATISATTSTIAAAPEPTTSQPPSPPTRKATTKQAAPAPVPAPVTEEPKPGPACDPNYSGCVPVASDVDCAGGSGDGPAYVQGPIRVIGKDIYGLDRDGDGIACE